MTGTIRILAIAPYSGMESLLSGVSAEFPEIDLTISVGDLSRGVEVAQANFHANYDAIISRGGTAQLLQRSVSLPVIEIGTSALDILSTLMLSGAGSHKVAVVGFPNITEELAALRRVLPYEMDIYPIQSDQHAASVLRALDRHAYHAILCDMIAYTTARELEMNAFLITSGTQSIRAAFSTALWYCSSNRRLRDENRFLRQLLQGRDASTAVFDGEGKLFFSTLSGEDSAVLRMLAGRIDQVPSQGKRRFLQRFRGLLYSIQSQRLNGPEGQLVAFDFTASKPPVSGSRYGVSYHSSESVEEALSGQAVLMNDLFAGLHETVDRLNAAGEPVLVSGEEGTGRGQLARIIYLRGGNRRQPFVEIDCAGLGEKAWNFLLNHHTSPLCDKGNTLYLRNLSALSPQRCRQLLSAMLEMDVGGRNRLLFSCAGRGVGEDIMELAERLHCFILSLPALREEPERIDHLVGLTLNRLNIELATGILGVHPAAMEMLREYHWPQNYTQLRRVLHALATTAGEPLIQPNQVQAALAREQALTAAGPSREELGALDLSGTLEEINREVAAMVLEAHGGNHSRAAAGLGISRTTLWRMLGRKG